MNKFKNFLKNSHEIKVNFSQDDLENKSHYFMNFIKKNIRVLSLFAMVIPSYSYSYDFENSKVDQIVNQYSTDNGVSTKNFSIMKKDDEKGTRSIHDMGHLNTCKIILSSKGGGEFSNMLTNQNKIDSKLYEEMVINHELSHCMTNKRFIGTKLDYSSEKWMTDWVIGEYASNNEIKDLFEENFADSLAALTLLKNNNYSDKSILFLKKWAMLRESINKDSEQNGKYFESHNTSNVINYIVEHEKNLKYVNSNEFINIANNLASQAVLQSINANRMVEKDFIIDENGDPKSGGEKKLGKIGINYLNSIFANYKKTIRNISVNIAHDFYDGKSIKDNDSSSFNIAKNGFDFFHDQHDNWGEDKLKNSIDTIDNQLNKGNYYNQAMNSIKNKNHFNDFKNNIDKLIAGHYNVLSIEYVYEPYKIESNGKKPSNSKLKFN